MTDLTKAIRENMRQVVLDHAFKEKKQAAKQAVDAAGLALYMAYHEKYLPIMEQLPDGFLHKSSSFCVNIGWQYHKIYLGSKKPMTIESYWSRVPFDANDPAAIAFLSAVNAVYDIDNQIEIMSNKVTAILESVRTFKKLWEAWPEAKPLLEHFEEKPPATYLPAIQFNQINAELGLPPATTGFPWSHSLTGTGAYEIGHFGSAGFVKNQEVDTLAEAKQIVDAHNARLGV